MEKKILNTWPALKCENAENAVSVNVWGREYKIEDDIMFSSINVLGDELLSAPIRIIAEENETPGDVTWCEIENFLLEKDDEKAVICGSMRADYIAVDTTTTIEFDGYTAIDLKVMPRTFTIFEGAGGVRQVPGSWSVDKLWVEIPLKKKYAKNFHYFPNRSEEDGPTFEGKSIPFSRVASSREIPSSMAMSFKPLIWVGDETRGFCFSADDNRNWQPKDKKKAIEIIDGEEEVIIRLRLIESLPVSWLYEDGEPYLHAAFPLNFSFAFQVTPVKPFPENPFKEKNLHIDCYNGKIKEEYNDYLANEYVKGSGENCYDRMKRLGVTTLFIHEKWNPIQNYWKISPDTEKRTREIVDECHKRGIKVIPYFGYEISTLSPDWARLAEKCARMPEKNKYKSFNWYRKPNQRAVAMCPTSEFGDLWVEEIKKVIEKFDFDGLYVDTFFIPYGCCNDKHGCGFYDHTGEYQPSYSINKTRELARNLFDFFEKRGGVFNPHISSCCNIPSFSFFHLQWDGEDVQWHVKKLGEDSIEYLTPDYIRTEYIGRNFGLNYEFIAYTFDNWSFEDSMTVALVHGVLPRPNVIGEPLEKISPVWKIIDDYDVTGAKFVPYWENNIDCGAEKTKASYFEKDGKRLAIISNMSNIDNNDVNIKLSDNQIVFDAFSGEEISMPVSVKGRKHRILLINDK